MKYLFLILLSIIVHTSQAQKIHFTDSSNKWVFSYMQDYVPHIKKEYRLQYKYTGSVSIAGREFKNLSGIGLIYEDSLSKVVYYNDTSTILFNYNWNVGDTFYTPYGNIVVLNTIQGIDSILINGYYHRTFSVEFGNNSFSWYYHIIEGLGSDFLTPAFPRVYGNSTTNAKIICFSNNGQTPEIDSGYNINLSKYDCNNPFLHITERYVNNDVYKVYPQPAQGSVTFGFPSFLSGVISIYNTLGQQVYHTSFDHKQKLEIVYEDWRGLYIYQVKTDHAEYTGKLIFQ